MGRINLGNIQRQMARVEAEYEEMQVFSRPVSLNPAEILVNPDNRAALNDSKESIRQLADSIEAAGLIHPLTVNKIGEHRYMLLSGERRFRAITTHLHWEHIPCTVYDNLDADMMTLVTVEANMEAREYTAADRLALYQQLEAALRSLKERGKFKGGIGRKIADILGVSEQQVGKYKRIVNNTTDEERRTITNINKMAAEIRKTETEFQFSSEPDIPEEEKTETGFQFSGELDTPEEEKTETEFQFSSRTATQEAANFATETALQEVLEKTKALLHWARQTKQPDRLEEFLSVAYTALSNAKAAAAAVTKEDG